MEEIRIIGKMNYYMDIHSHILPGVDDGSKNMDETIALLTECHKEGINRIIATPHFIPGHRSASPEKLREVYAEVVEEAKKQLPDMEIFLGNEIYYKENVVNQVKEKKALTMADTNYCLIEFNTGSDYRILFQAVKEFTESGYRPILAHVERYDCLYRKKNRMEDLIDAGAYLQINAESLAGGIFDRHSSFVRSILEEGLVHFLGSDCHRMTFRKPVMSSALDKCKKESIQSRIDQIMTQNVEKLFKNEWI